MKWHETLLDFCKQDSEAVRELAYSLIPSVCWITLLIGLIFNFEFLGVSSLMVGLCGCVRSIMTYGLPVMEYYYLPLKKMYMHYKN